MSYKKKKFSSVVLLVDFRFFLSMSVIWVNVDEAGNEPISFDQELLPAYRFLRIA